MHAFIRKQFATLLIVSAIDNTVNALKAFARNIPLLRAHVCVRAYEYLLYGFTVQLLSFSFDTHLSSLGFLCHHRMVYYFIIIIKLFAVIRFCRPFLCSFVVAVVAYVTWCVVCSIISIPDDSENSFVRCFCSRCNC